MWKIYRKVTLDNELLDQEVYGCKTKEEAEEKIKSFDEEGLFIQEYKTTREEYINHLKEKGYVIDGHKAIWMNGDLVSAVFLIMHYSRETEVTGYDEDYCLKMLYTVDLDGEIIRSGRADEHGNYYNKDGKLIEKNLDDV